MEVSLMKDYPKTKRDSISNDRLLATAEELKLAKEFEYEYFDGPRKLGLGGFKYINGFWEKTVKNFIEFYSLNKKSSLLDVGCAKGFTLFEFAKEIPEMRIRGIDISSYCYNNSLPIIRPHIDIGCCSSLPYESNSFDLAISIATSHNLDLNGVKRSLKELMRVSKKCFVKVNGYRNEEEKIALEKWNLVADTILHVDEWNKLFEEVGYEGEWEFFTP